MGWERGRYYTRSRKVNGRVVREYIGGGEVGRLVAQIDAIDGAEREAKAVAWRAAKARLEAVEADLDAIGRLVNLMAHASLVAAGFRQHNRSEWRRRRERKHDSKN